MTDAARCVEVARPWAIVAAVVLGGRLAWQAGVALWALRRKRWPWAWRTSLQLLGPRAIIITAAVIAAFLLLDQLDVLSEIPFLRTPDLAASLIPLAAGITAAFVFSPEDEPGLEATLTYPRPMAYVLLERWALVLAQHGMLAVLTGYAGMWLTKHTDKTVLTDWIIPTLVLMGVGACVTLITRQAVFGAALAGLVWWAMLYFADGVLIERPYLWPLHLYLAPRHPDFNLNRVTLLLIGLQLFALALQQLKDEARLAWGLGRRSSRPRPAVPAAAGARTLPPPRRLSTGLALRLHQVWALIVYEARMQWRRRTMLAVLVWPILLAMSLALVALKDLGGESLKISTAVTQHQIALALMLAAWLPMYVGLLVVTAVVADVIPKDRQLGVSDLLDALPLAPATYFAGKVLSVYVGLLGLLVGAMLAIGGVWWWVLGPFDVGLYLRMWVGGAVPLAVLNGGLVVLLAANLVNRRQAALVGLALTLLSIATMFATWPIPWLNALSPARSALLRYFLRETTPSLAAAGTAEHVWWALGIGSAELLVAWFLAWLGRQRHEAHA